MIQDTAVNRLSINAIRITSATAIIIIEVKLNSKPLGKKKLMNSGTGFDPNPLSISSFKANGFNNAIGVDKRLITKMPVICGQ